MRPWTQLASLWLAVPLLACLVEDPDAPDPLGEPYGRYGLDGRLIENTCGEGVPAIDPLSFEVELRRLGATSVWLQVDAPLAYGSVSSEGVWEVQGTVVQNVYDADPLTGTAGCALNQTESIRLEGPPLPDTDRGVQDGALPDAGASAPIAPERMDGTLEIRFAPTSGSDCSASLAAFGGPFGALPCTVRYELSAERRD